MSQQEINQPKFLSVADITRRLAVTADTVLVWIKRGDLIAMDVSRGRGERPRWRISEADLQGFLDRRRTVPLATLDAKRRKGTPKIPRHV